MASRKVVLFIRDNSYYLSGFRDGPTHMRGMVENGAWNLYIVKDSKYRWTAHRATSRNQCNAANWVSEFNPADVCWVEVPETMLADYNTVINWATARKKTACQRPQV